VGLLSLGAASDYNARHPGLRRKLLAVLVVSSSLALLLGVLVEVNLE
jgi:hypothetical protein